MDDFTGLVKFSAEWCGPCKAFAPVIKEVVEETGIEYIEADIDDETGSELSIKFGVRSVPTTIAFLEGKPVDAIVGSATKDRVVELVNKINNNNS